MRQKAKTSMSVASGLSEHESFALQPSISGLTGEA